MEDLAIDSRRGADDVAIGQADACVTAGAGGVGVGVLHNGSLAHVLDRRPELVDAIGVIPETLWHEQSGAPRYEPIQSAIDDLRPLVARYPVVFHGVGLSLGSAGPIDLDHVEQLALAAQWMRPRWVSEQLAAFRVRRGGEPVHAGVGLPIAFDDESLKNIGGKVTIWQERMGVRVLLENSAVYVDVPGAPWTEAGLLNRLCDATGCGVLLDLHNLMVNELNLGWDAQRYLDELDLANVVEIHVAGGERIGRWYTDAHSGPCPRRVLDILDAVVREAAALQLVTFEVHESRVESMGVDGVARELGRIRGRLTGAGRIGCGA